MTLHYITVITISFDMSVTYSHYYEAKCCIIIPKQIYSVVVGRIPW